MNIAQEIQRALDDIEQRHHVRVLYACESGSRAWGFASQDSDYDVRFIYQHASDWYVSIEEGRDVIDEKFERDLDVSGWDLRKALRVLRKSNPPLLEWLTSPLVYRRDDEFFSGFRDLASTYYSPPRCMLHYLHMARGNWKDYLFGRPEVSLKKYLYVLRPLLGCIWIERELEPVPISFPKVIDRICGDSELAAAIRTLIQRKRAGEELRKGPPDSLLNKFIEGELDWIEAVAPKDEPEFDSNPLDSFFRRRLGFSATN